MLGTLEMTTRWMPGNLGPGPFAIHELKGKKVFYFLEFDISE
jgi:hypothetical protein